MNINLYLITDLYKKTAIIILILSVSFAIIVSFLKNSFFKGYSFGIGCFLIFLNVIGIYFIGKFSINKSQITKDRIVFSILLFLGKLFFILLIIFLLIKFHLVNNIWFLGGLSLGFAVFFIANLIILPVKIYKQEKAESESC